MPCFTRVKTSLIDLNTIEEAAKVLGIQVIKRTPNSYTLRKGGEQIGIERNREGEPFYVAQYSGTDNYQGEILKPITAGYTASVVKAFYKSKGYTVAAGKPNELIFTKYS